MSQTPRTDDRLSTGLCSDIALAAFTRGLERELNAEKAKNQRLREALEEIRRDLNDVIELHYKNGPQWTSKEGNEYYDASYVVNSANEKIEKIDVALVSNLCQLEPVSNADELRCESVFMAEARSFAAQCWCHDSTKDIPMDTRLAEAMASSIAHWMDTAARHCRNEDYYRSLLHKCGEIIGEDSYICDDGSVSQDVLCAKVPELVKSIVQTHIPRTDVEPLVRALENFISVGMEFYDMECGESGGAAINQAEQALETFTAKHGGEA